MAPSQPPKAACPRARLLASPTGSWHHPRLPRQPAAHSPRGRGPPPSRTFTAPVQWLCSCGEEVTGALLQWGVSSFQLAATTEVPFPWHPLYQHPSVGATYLGEPLSPSPYSLKHSPVFISVHRNWARSQTIQFSLQIGKKKNKHKALKESI